MKVNGAEWNRIKFTEKSDFVKFLNICTSHPSSQPNSILRSKEWKSGKNKMLSHGLNVKLNLNKIFIFCMTTSGHLWESEVQVARWFLMVTSLNMQNFQTKKAQI